ncbi:MAG: M48 family metallopeptidase [Candidatus Omnitrophota bacterium]
MTGPEGRLPQAKAYQRIRQRLTLFHLFFTPAVLLIIYLSPWSALLKDFAMRPFENAFGVTGVYFLYFSLTQLVLDLPLVFYGGYVLEKKYQLTTQTLSAWAREFLKRAGLSFAIALILVELLYFLIRCSETDWWFWAWLGYAGFSILMGRLFPVFIVPLFYKYSPIANDELRQRILALAERSKMPVENIYSINLSKTTKKANAAFMGIGRSRRVVLSDTLLEKFTIPEIETVLAHELGHYRHRDIWKMVAFSAVLSGIFFWTLNRIFLAAAIPVSDVLHMPLLFFALFVMNALTIPLQSAFSRRMERAADRFALETSRDPEAFIRALQKLGEINLSDPDPDPLYAKIFYDHPPIGERIRRAKAFVLGGSAV